MISLSPRIPMTDTSVLAARFNADDINQTIQRALASAGLDTSTGPLQGVTDTIRKALSRALPSVRPHDVAPREMSAPPTDRASPLGRTDRSEPTLPGALELPGQFI